MSLSIEVIGSDGLAEYASVPSVVEVKSMLVVEEMDRGVGGHRLQEQPVLLPYRKDYDAYGEGGPLDWPKRFDVSQWRFWIARECGDPVGGAAVAWSARGTDMDRMDLALLWDIRVRATRRRQGVGTALFREAAMWAKSIGSKSLKIETQNVNAAACRFYAEMGCVLSRIDRSAYMQRPEIADETMLVWHLNLSS